VTNVPDFNGRSVIVMGAGNALGSAIAHAFADAGANVAVTSATTDAEEVFGVQRLAKAIGAKGRRSMAEAVDLSIGTNVQVAVRQIVKGIGLLDVLVLAPELYLQKPAQSITDAEWARIIGVNLSAIFYACRSAGREMGGRDLPRGRENNRGRIVVVMTVHPESEGAGSVAYAAAKAGVLGLLVALADEWQESGITVNGIEADEATASQAAACALWLASDDAGQFSGRVFTADAEQLI
jgi:NAD(P)-dependent dehydrogenase (short-subunit alcohol dehydrogenase family)